MLLADEINRAPAKTQSALLEAMQEYQVTVDGQTLPLPRPFIVLATQNPVEQEGVYRLPEAQLDRFLLRVEMGYPGFDHEVNLLKLHSDARRSRCSRCSRPDVILGLQRKLPHVYGAGHRCSQYIVQLAEESRRHPDVLLGASPRAALEPAPLRPGPGGPRGPALLHARGRAGRSPSACSATALILRPEAEIEGKHVADVVRDVLADVLVLETV